MYRTITGPAGKALWRDLFTKAPKGKRAVLRHRPVMARYNSQAKGQRAMSAGFMVKLRAATSILLNRCKHVYADKLSLHAGKSFS